jgi:hypothetical protein
MRRSFKLATAFTGVTALAGGFGPAALAAPAHHSGKIHNAECGANDDGVSNQVHLYYPNDDHPAECFASAGQVTVDTTIASFCAGNNNGSFYRASAPAFPVPFKQSSPRHAVGSVYLTSLYIASWSGHAKCT